MALEKNHFYRFGSFRLDPAKRLLKRGQKSVSLMPKAFDTLLVLVENRNRLVGKEELMKTLWPDSFVEEANLAQNVAVLRKALGDSPEEHRYILTVPGHGYRFAAKVSEEIEDDEADLVIERHSRSRVLVEESGVRSGHAGILAIFSSVLKRRWNWILGGAAIVAFILAVVLRLTSHRPPPLGESDLVLVSDFVNTTGEPIFDGSLKQALKVKLSESPYFRVEDDSRVRQTLVMMGRSKDERVVWPVAREVCERSGAKVVIAGSILRLGNNYSINVDARNCLTGASLTHQEIDTEQQDQVLNRLGQIIQPLRRKLGESMSSMQKFDTPIDQSTTKSLAALKAFASGEEKRAQGRESESLPDYKLATELDPDFAMAYARLAAISRNLGQVDAADAYLRKAFERREHISEKEKFYVQARYYEDTAREPVNEIETCKLWSEVYPHDFNPLNCLVNEYIEIGQLEKAIEAGQQALRINPDHALPYASLARAYERASHFPEAKAICGKAIAEKVDSFWIHLVLYRIAFAEGDDRAIQQALEWFRGKPQESNFTYYQAKAALSVGEVRRSRELFERARLLAEGRGLKEQAIAFLNGQAQFEADVGNTREARTLAELALRTMPNSVRHEAFATLTLARSGDVHRAEILINKVAQKPLLGTGVNDVVFPCIRAAIDLDRKRPAKAIEALQPSAPYDLGTDSGGVTLYYRGLAYLQLHSGKDAATQFQRITNNRGVVTIDIYWPLAHLGLARAYATGGDTDKARAMYREFLNLWRNADPNLRPLKEAKAEYSKLSTQ